MRCKFYYQIVNIYSISVRKKTRRIFFLSKSEGCGVVCLRLRCMSWLLDSVFGGVAYFYSAGHEENDGKKKKKNKNASFSDITGAAALLLPETCSP